MTIEISDEHMNQLERMVLAECTDDGTKEIVVEVFRRARQFSNPGTSVKYIGEGGILCFNGVDHSQPNYFGKCMRCGMALTPMVKMTTTASDKELNPKKFPELSFSLPIGRVCITFPYGLQEKEFAQALRDAAEMLEAPSSPIIDGDL